MSPWNECLANVPKACESVCCICVRGSFLFQWNCVQLRHGNLSTTTYRNRSSLRGTPKPFPTCPPVSIPKGGGRGGGPPPLKSIPFQLKSIPWGGGGHIDSINLFGGGGGGGWRALSFDKSILSRGQINFQPTPIFVNKNSSFALPELAFVKDAAFVVFLHSWHEAVGFLLNFDCGSFRCVPPENWIEVVFVCSCACMWGFWCSAKVLQHLGNQWAPNTSASSSKLASSSSFEHVAV